jgi:uncharacterized membrane protein YhhN
MRFDTILARAAIGLALLAGFTYLLIDIWITNVGNTDYSENALSALIALKGAGVWFLAMFAILVARCTDGRLLAAVMAFGAFGDILVESDMDRGAIAFLIGHILAIILYLRNRREILTPSQRLLAFVLVPCVVYITWLLTQDVMAVGYSLALSVMAVTAWISRFSRLWVGIGAMLFVASDLLIFADLGENSGGTWYDPAIWGLYFTGQAMITLGVTAVLSGERKSF